MEAPIVDDLIKEFLVESNEGLERMDSVLVKLESDPSPAELLASIFRTIRTIEGTCGFLGLEKLGSVAQAGENMLSCKRDGQLTLTAIRSVLLEMVDGIHGMLGKISTNENDGHGGAADLVCPLKNLAVEVINRVSQRQSVDSQAAPR